MRNLRTQLLASHLVLVVLMLIIMAGAVFNFVRLGRSVDRILKDNYKSVVAAQAMKEALERQDSAATFLLAGQVQKAREQYESNAPRFEQAFHIEATNITEVGEREIAHDIGEKYQAYSGDIHKLLYADPPMAESDSRDFYFRVLEPGFVHLKQRAQDVLNINQAAILRADERAKSEARSASITAMAVTAAAFVLAVFFALRVVRVSLGPLRSLARQAEEIGAGHLNQRIDVDRSDEIGALAIAFNSMTESLREARRLETERLHRAERMSDAALESLYDPVIVTDAKGSVVHLNRAAEGLFGPEARAKSVPILNVVGNSRIAEAVATAIHQERISASEDEKGLVNIQEGEMERIYRLRVTPMRDEDQVVLGAAAVLEDVTHLRELDRLKSEFIGVASHELRTPVTSLLLSVQLMEEGAVGELTPDQREVIEAQKEDLQRLDRMMHDLLDITRLEAGVTPPRFEILNPKDIVDTAVQAISSQAEAKGVALTTKMVGEMPSVRADRGQINRVLLNILNNALRHTPSSGEIHVSCAATSKGVEFAVRDTGAGIPKAYLPRIFERFVQVPGATRGGAGLGLSIAATIVKAHGGTLSADSKEGEGSTFTIILASTDLLPERKEPSDGTNTGH